MPRPRLYISYDPPVNRLSALEFGRVDDGQPDDCWERVGDAVGLLLDAPDGDCVGFLLVDLADYDVDDPEHAELWESPRFDVPALGLTDVPPNAIIVATRALYGEERSLNRRLFSAAIDEHGEAALAAWLRCLQAGDSMAHYALGYTLLGLGRLPEAYRHLRHYCEIAPAEPWSWRFLGLAAAAIGEDAEAEAALERAIELDDPEDPTDAEELLERLRNGEVDLHVPASRRPPEGWGTTLAALIEATGLDHHAVWSEDTATVIFDTDAYPAVLERAADGATSVRAQVGYIFEMAFETMALGREIVFDRFYELDDEDGLEFLDEDQIWIVFPLDADDLDPGDPQRLRARVTAVAARAARVRGNYDHDCGTGSLGEPWTFAELVARADAD